MKRLLVIAILGGACAAAPIAAHAQIYKWVDEKGITHYGERPPTAASPARKLDIPLQGNGPDVPPPGCYTIRCQYERMRADRLAREEEWREEMQLRARVADSMRPAPTQRSPDLGVHGAPVYPVISRRHVAPVHPPVPRHRDIGATPTSPLVGARAAR